MIEFFDAKCMIGRRRQYRENAPITNEDILELMDRCNISHAITFHSVAKEEAISIGNQLLVDETKDNERFLRQWCIPVKTHIAEFISEMKKNDVTSVRMFPDTFWHILEKNTANGILGALGECRIPVFMDADELNTDAVYQLCTKYHQNIFVLAHPDYGNSSKYYSLMENCGNLFLGTSSFLDHNGIKYFSEKFGADRLVFESGMPTGSSCAAVSLVCYADISVEEKQLIASENMKRLLSEVNL